MNTTYVSIVVILSLVAAMVWIDRRCLTDLANTRDEDLRYLNRNAWALVIVVSFPLGPMIYMLYGKGPGRYA